VKTQIGLGLLFIPLAIILGVTHRSAPDAVGKKGPVEPLRIAGDPVLVELFTSEGCSSCPPADAILTRLSEQTVDGVEVITLSEHVDYWNHLGWRDPYSSSQFSQRQAAYANRFGGNSIYTPQMVVDGQQEFVGSDGSAARAAIANAAQRPKAQVTIDQTDDPNRPVGGAVQVSVRVELAQAIAAKRPVDVLLALAESGLRSSVRSGENGGRSLAHSSVVRRLDLIGSFDPKTNSSFSVQHLVTPEAKWNRSQMRVVAIAQERNSLHVIGVSSAAVLARSN
jgi:hypothetical protein